MTDNEYKYARLVAFKNIVIVLATAGLIAGLFYFSRSWHSLWAFVLLAGMSSISTNDDYANRVIDVKSPRMP